MILPAFNEEENLTPMVDATVEALTSIDSDFEVIIVDDGSRDSTWALARRLADRHPAVRPLRHAENLGYGAALRTGFRHAEKGFVFYTDADRQFDVAELQYFLPLMDDHDMAVGFRVYRYDSVIRSMLSWFYNRLVSIMFRVRVRDVDCAFKLMRREVLDRMHLQSSDFFIDTELIAMARRWNFRIVQKGVRHYPRVAGETTVRASDIGRTLRTIAVMWKRIYFPSTSQRQEAGATAATNAAASADPLPPEEAATSRTEG